MTLSGFTKLTSGKSWLQKIWLGTRSGIQGSVKRLSAGPLGWLRRINWLYEFVRCSRAQRLEQEYVALREQYYGLGGPLFAEPGYLVKSRELLHRRWKGPRQVRTLLKDVRLFAVSPAVVGAIRPLAEFARSFDTVAFDYGKYCSKMEQGDQSLRARFQADLLDAFAKAHSERPIDLAWLSVTNTFCGPETLDKIRRAGVPVAVLNTDDKHLYLKNPRLNFPNGQKPLIGSVDVHVTNSLECLRWYMAEGAAAYYAPQGADPELYRPLPIVRDLDVSFIGAAYGMRRRFVESLRRAGIRVECFGQGWEGGLVSDNEKIEIYNRSKINLGIGGVGYSDRITCIKGRDVQVPASGNVLLTTYDAELARMWCVGREILCYYNELDCVEQIRYYLERTDEAEAIGRAARERALREHTWTHRMLELLRWMRILEAPDDRL